jgi:trk system potassium uptake protein TrkH
VKTTTAFVLVSMAVARARLRRNPNAFGREIGYESVSRAAKLALAAAAFVALMAGIVLAAEGNRTAASCRGGVFLDLLFETVSAFGTVGLSTGVTPTLAPISKLALVLTMYVGRVGPLTLFATLARPPAEDRVRLPDEAVLVG